MRAASQPSASRARERRLAAHLRRHTSDCAWTVSSEHPRGLPFSRAVPCVPSNLLGREGAAFRAQYCACTVSSGPRGDCLVARSRVRAPYLLGRRQSSAPRPNIERNVSDGQRRFSLTPGLGAPGTVWRGRCVAGSRSPILPKFANATRGGSLCVVSDSPRFGRGISVS